MDVMEITPVDGEINVSEESVEASASDSVPALPAPDPGEADSGDSVEINESASVQGDSVEQTQEEMPVDSETESPSEDVVADSAETEQSEDIAETDDGTSEDRTVEKSEEIPSEESQDIPETLAPLLMSEPFPVYTVDAPQEDIDVVTYSVGSTYPGTFSSTYLDYFSGIAEKLSPSVHYVAYRSGQYEYVMAWGKELTYDGSRFRGDALNICRIYRENGDYNYDYLVEWFTDSVNMTPGGNFVYSDLGNYSALTKGGTGIEFTALLFAVGFAVVYSVCHDLYDYVMQHIYRKS